MNWMQVLAAEISGVVLVAGGIYWAYVGLTDTASPDESSESRI
jgi:hypothetical protein